MRKILMRASMNPLDNLDSAKVIAYNKVGNNTGNMLFSHSVARTLMQEDVVIDTISTCKQISDKRIARINEEYECFVIPLANAFRDSFRAELIVLTEFIEKLTIPCVVIGVGVQLGLKGNLNNDFAFDEDARKFVKAVLNKSAMLGLRGDVTAAYLKKLGFQEEKDFTVIGCPAMYMNGEQIQVKQCGMLTENSKVSVNRKVGVPKKLHEFLARESERFEDYMFVPQGIEDLRLLYIGMSLPEELNKKMHPTYPSNVNCEIYASGHEIGFTNVASWMNYLKERDFSFGSRIHGNIAAVVAGVPAYIFVPDMRILELARYHNIQHCMAADVNADSDIFEIYSKADFNSVIVGHKERFEHYLDFLEWNGLSHVYGKERVNKEVPFDRLLAEKESESGVTPYTGVPACEQLARKVKYYSYYGVAATLRHIRSMV